jgi:hypothetical protein
MNDYFYWCSAFFGRFGFVGGSEFLERGGACYLLLSVISYQVFVVSLLIRLSHKIFAVPWWVTHTGTPVPYLTYLGDSQFWDFLFIYFESPWLPLHKISSSQDLLLPSRSGDTTSMGSTRPSASVRDEDVQRTHLLRFPALPNTNNEAASKIQGSKQWVPLVAGGYVFSFIPTQPTV